MSVGKRIKELRTIKGLTQTELGELVGATANAVALYETDYFFPHESVLFKLINVFGCDANYLFQDVVTMKSNASDITVEEYEMVRRYRTIDMYGKKNVNSILMNEVERCSAN